MHLSTYLQWKLTNIVAANFATASGVAVAIVGVVVRAGCSGVHRAVAMCPDGSCNKSSSQEIKAGVAKAKILFSEVQVNRVMLSCYFRVECSGLVAITTVNVSVKSCIWKHWLQTVASLRGLHKMTFGILCDMLTVKQRELRWTNSLICKMWLADIIIIGKSERTAKSDGLHFIQYADSMSEHADSVLEKSNSWQATICLPARFGWVTS